MSALHGANVRPRSPWSADIPVCAQCYPRSAAATVTAVDDRPLPAGAAFEDEPLPSFVTAHADDHLIDAIAVEVCIIEEVRVLLIVFDVRCLPMVIDVLDV